MPLPEALPHYAWQSGDFPACTLNLRVSSLAARLNLPLQHWEEDGLGPASGFVCRLPAGLVVGATELEHAVKYLNARGPSIEMEIADLVELGLESIKAQILSGLNLAEENLEWFLTEEGLKSARMVLAYHRGKPA